MSQGLHLVTLMMGLFCLHVFLLRIFPSFARQYGVLLDVPNWRSSHVSPVVRGSGVLFVWSALLSWIGVQLIHGTSYLTYMIIGGLLIAAVSFYDDIRPISVRVRLFVHTVGSVFFLLGIPTPDILTSLFGPFDVLWWPAATIFMVAMVNLYNFMDGIDGLCASHSLLVLLIWVTFSAQLSPGNVESLLCLFLAVPLLAFLIQNWSPASTFMGDVGSTFLGYTFACLAIIQVPGLPRSTNFFALMMLMMPFIFDACFTLFVRCARGEKWHEAHCSHIFQRLVRAGYSHRAVSLVYAFMTLYTGLVIVSIQNLWITSFLIGIPLFMFPPLALYLWLSVVEARILVPPVRSLLEIDVLKENGSADSSWLFADGSYAPVSSRAKRES